MSAAPTQIALYGVNKPSAMIAPEAFEAKRMALQLAHTVYEVFDAASQEAAARAHASVKNLITQIEEARKEVKSPVIAVGKQIDALASNFIFELETEQRRLSLLVGSYQDAERRKARLAQEEAERKELARMFELEEAERKRAAAENDNRTGTLLPDIEAIRQKAAEDVVQIRQDAANAVVRAPEGSMIKKTWKFEVTDIKALFKAFPDLCIIEPNNAAIRAIIKNNQSIPGLKVWSETAALLKSSAPAALPKTVADYDY